MMKIVRILDATINMENRDLSKIKIDRMSSKTLSLTTLATRQQIV